MVVAARMSRTSWDVCTLCVECVPAGRGGRDVGVSGLVWASLVAATALVGGVPDPGVDGGLGCERRMARLKRTGISGTPTGRPWAASPGSARGHSLSRTDALSMLVGPRARVSVVRTAGRTAWCSRTSVSTAARAPAAQGCAASVSARRWQLRHRSALPRCRVVRCRATLCAGRSRLLSRSTRQPCRWECNRHTRRRTGASGHLEP